MTRLDPSRRSFLKTSLALAGTTPLAADWLDARASEAGRPLLAYVGTFSSPLRDVLPTQVDLPPGNGRGIHLFRVDRATGAMTPAGVCEMGTSPSCLALNAAGTRLYSANETARVGENKAGTVSAFSMDRTDGHLTLLGTVPSGGAGPTYVSIHPSGRFLLVANYFGGSVAVLPIQADGRLADPTGRFLYCCNQRADNIAVFRVDRQTGGLAFTGHYTPVGNPSCIVFLDLAKAD